MEKWDKMFKNGTSKICERQPLKILPGPFLNTLIQMQNPNIITNGKQSQYSINLQKSKVLKIDLPFKLFFLLGISFLLGIEKLILISQANEKL